MGVLWTERELGDVYRNLGEYSKAENLLKHNLMVQKKHYKEQSEKHAKTSLYLAKVYVDRGEYKQAKNLFKASLIIYKKYYGANHIETARLLENIAQIHFLENHLDDAEKILLEALRIFLSCKHLESYRVLENISELFLKKLEQAKQAGDSRSVQNNYKNQAITYLNQAQTNIKEYSSKDSLNLIRIQKKLENLAVE